MIKKVLTGHVSENTAFNVDDYPYGRTLRCRIRYWIETDAKRGSRFVYQTSNPKRRHAWNAPKKSTYSLLGEGLYLDENDHVQSASITEYSKPAEVLEFIRTFPAADTTVLRVFAPAKERYLNDLAEGRKSWHVNGANVTTDADREDARRDAAVWHEIVSILAVKGTGS